MNKISRRLNIINLINLILWSGMLLSVVFLDYNVKDLKMITFWSIFIVLVGLVFDVLKDNEKRKKSKAALEYMANELKNNNEQGDK